MNEVLKIAEVSIEKLQAFAKIISNNIAPIDCILLSGDLGAGKTTFSQNLINNIAESESAPQQNVTSPTFNIIHEYIIGTKSIWHVDLYRIENIEDAEEIGLQDGLNSNICIIEWPEIYADFYPDNHLSIKIENSDNKDKTRIISLSASGNWIEKLDKIQAELNNL